MSTQTLQKNVSDILAIAGIKINGPNSWDLQIHNDRFYNRVLSEGTMGLAESYMDGWWDCDSIDEFTFRVLRTGLYKHARFGWKVKTGVLVAKIVNMQSKGRAAGNVRRHYDIGNKLYKLMLDKRMIYTCAYWKGTDSLEVAQENKLDLVCRKIGLQPGQRVLDIGCGWGGFAKFAAERYGTKVVGVTLSPSQLELAVEMCKGLPVEIRLQDYRDVDEQFDHIVSIGMFEQVGLRNFRTYMKVAARNLKNEGLFLFHTIGNSFSRTTADPFMNHLFPGCLLPSIKQLGEAMEHIFVIEDLHNFGAYYDPTLMAWFQNFDRNWNQLKEEYGERFYRMWKYYLLSNAGSFRARHNQLWQIVLSKKGVLGGYQALR
jgi:cyclopropane-fatty-acyl-phospholipid synthase